MIFALHAHLHILQLEEYSVTRFLRWWIRHPFVLRSTGKKPLIWTSKARLLRLSTFITLAALVVIASIAFPLWSAALPVLLALFTPLPLVLTLIILLPLENWKRRQLVTTCSETVQNAKDLTVVGITGSYGKTSVKEFLFAILRQYETTVRTPESYNTPLGIAKTVRLELTSKVRFFLCEMGAYRKGDITALTHQVPLDYSILTAVGNQHLERFGSINNTTETKFEIVHAVQPSHALVNFDNEHIKAYLSEHPELEKVHTYSLQDPSASFFVTQSHFLADGVEFSLRTPTGTLNLRSSLFGTSNLMNIVAAASMASLLGVPKQTIETTVPKIRPAPHRLELKKIHNATLIDNAFSSNEAGFRMVVKDLSSLPGKKALITPGIIELGSDNQEVHTRIGMESAEVFERIYLVGNSARTKAFDQGVKSVKNETVVEFLQNETNLWPLVEELSHEFDWILIENDLPDNYSQT